MRTNIILNFFWFWKHWVENDWKICKHCDEWFTQNDIEYIVANKEITKKPAKSTKFDAIEYNREYRKNNLEYYRVYHKLRNQRKLFKKKTLQLTKKENMNTNTKIFMKNCRTEQ